MEGMFKDCRNLGDLNISTFDTSSVSKMNGMFQNCINLKTLDLSNFDTSNVNNFQNMFSNCVKLVSLNLSNFKTSIAVNTKQMFSSCILLEYLNINQFNFDLTNYRNKMFISCNNLTSLELNNFKFSGNNTNLMYCLNLLEPPIGEDYNCSGFCNNSLYGYEYNNTCYTTCPKKTNVVQNISNYLCEYLNCENLGKFYNYDQNNCINEIPDGYFLNDTKYNTTDKCHSYCKTCDEKETSLNTNCKSCIDSVYLQYANFTNCTPNCTNGYYNDSNNNKICYCPDEKCKACTLESLNQSLCVSCNTERNFYPIYNESSINNTFIDCYKEPIGYFLFNESFYEKCYKSCKFCSGFGNESNHNCIECLDNYKITLENNCLENCTEDIKYKYEYNNSCLESCPFGTKNFNNSHLCEDLNCSKYYNYNGTECIDEILEGYYLYNETLKSVHKCDNKCKNCSLESTQKNLCISCNNNSGYYPMFNDTPNENPFINCYKEPFGYYLLNNVYVVDKRCDKFEEVNFNSNSSNHNLNLSYFSCPLYYYCDSSNNYFCTKDTECPENYTKFIEEKNKCIDNCTNDLKYRYEYNNKCFDSCPKGTISSSNNSYLCEINKECNPTNLFLGKCQLNNNTNNINMNNSSTAEAKDKMINNIREEIMSGGMDELIDDIVTKEKKDLVVNDDNTIFQITSTENQKNNKNNNLSTLILGECESILKNVYNIDENLALLIFKIDYYQPGSQVPIIGYEVYHPLNKSKLDLNYCKNSNINFNIPISINENDLFKYDPENEYYNDVCYPSTSNGGTDILLNDRKSEFNDNQMSLCEKECTFTEYETDTKLANCECGVKNKEFLISEIINQTDILSHNFISKEESSTNMVTMKCYYTLFTKDGLAKNIGSYILLIITFLFICLGISFYKCGYPSLEELITEIINIKNKKEKNEKQKDLDIDRKDTTGEKTLKKSKTKKRNNKKNNLKKSNTKEIIKTSKTRKKNLKKNKTKINISENNIKNVNDKIERSMTKKNVKKTKKKIIKKGINKNIKLNLNKINSNNSNSKSIIQLQFQNIINIVPHNNEKITNKKDFSNYYDYDLNIMCYKRALKHDKRKFCDYYFSLIKIKNYLIFSFCPNRDYNSAIIKISLFLIFFSIFYFINALFFNEKTIHKIYEDKGFYNFIYLVPYIFYSFAISHTLNTIIRHIFLSERNIYKIKDVKKDEWELTEKIKKLLTIKYICFYCIGTIFLMFVWYYLSSFGAVYHNTQIYLIKNTSISFAVGLIYPFISCIFISILRNCALKGQNNHLLYNISKFCQYI